ncbi:MAG: hypothetical protein Q7U33_04855 [Methylotenera sp.]|uniref:hypothetical protein n=1 Tax=Methylotenera sp. TaxID=2051956 RepID=UPI0027171E78|nr:hypothetical protein [Methylotenera sp.]MDO9150691.1 hypothetical protein [Methylotenera sp.]
MQKEYSDYTIHRRQDKLSIYQQKEKLWWSNELNRWICTDAALIKAILANRQFEVPTYSVEKIIERIPVDLEHNITLVKYFPVALEGEAHKAIRKRHARQLMLNGDAALESFNLNFTIKLQALQDEAGIVFNLHDDLLMPSIQHFFAILLDIEFSKLSFSDSISQILDETLPLTKRIKINHIIAELINSLPDDLSLDEKYFRVSMLALGVDSLLGTLTESIVNVLLTHPGQALSNMSWPSDISVTGVPVIERILTQPLNLEGQAFQAGQRFRLYLDATGYADSDEPSYSQLYFGAGRHVCLGMPIGKKIWSLIAAAFANTHSTIQLHDVSRREFDNVFNIYNTIKVSFHD